MSPSLPESSAAGQLFKPNGTVRAFPHISLSTRTQIDHFDAGLSSVQGAREVIQMISSRTVVTRLMLGSNNLSDDGTMTLFEYLGSGPGKKYRIPEISLNSNGIGDSGLLAIAEYLKDNPNLKTLLLQNNHFVGSPPVTKALASAINSSGLETISLTTNRGLADSFIEQFLPRLDSPNLREIHLSVMNLTSRSTSHIIEYVSSPRCRLQSFKCNGNYFGRRSVRRIIRALERSNFGLLRVELYSNQSTPGAESEVTGEEEQEGLRGASVELWKESDNLLRRVLSRNSYLKTKTKTEALRLLQFARTLLLQANRANQIVESLQTLGHASLPSDATCHASVTSVFPFLSLPTELQLHILSFLAPILSPAQRVRIYTHASSLSTLPILLSLPERGVPAHIGNGCEYESRTAAWPWKPVVLQKEEDRDKWLDKVRCCVFEPTRNWDGQIPGYDAGPGQ